MNLAVADDGVEKLAFCAMNPQFFNLLEIIFDILRFDKICDDKLNCDQPSNFLLFFYSSKLLFRS